MHRRWWLQLMFTSLLTVEAEQWSDVPKLFQTFYTKSIAIEICWNISFDCPDRNFVGLHYFQWLDFDGAELHLSHWLRKFSLFSKEACKNCRLFMWSKCGARESISSLVSLNRNSRKCAILMYANNKQLWSGESVFEINVHSNYSTNNQTTHYWMITFLTSPGSLSVNDWTNILEISSLNRSIAYLNGARDNYCYASRAESTSSNPNAIWHLLSIALYCISVAWGIESRLSTCRMGIIPCAVFSMKQQFSTTN